MRAEAVARVERKMLSLRWDDFRANPPRVYTPGGSTRLWTQHEFWREAGIPRAHMLEVVWRDWGRAFADKRFVFAVEPNTQALCVSAKPY